MQRTRKQEIRRLQKKLIPVNLLVCILCIVASLSLFFMPLVKINLGTLASSKDLQAIVTDIAVAKLTEFVDKAGDSLGGEVGGGNGGENGDGSQGTENSPEQPNPDDGEVTARKKIKADGEVGSEGGSETGEEGGNAGSEGGENNGEGNEGDGGSNDDVTIADLLKEIDIEELVTPLVKEIFGAIKADISVSASNSLKVFTAQNKAETLLDELFFNEASGFVSQLEKTLVTGFGNALDAAGKHVQKAVVKAVVVPALKENLPKEYADLVDADKLQETIDNLDGAKNGADASQTIIEYIDGLAVGQEGKVDKLTAQQKEDITKQITELYDKTVEQTRNEETGENNFTVEAMITVMASEMMGGVGDFNLSDIIAGFVGGGNSDPDGGDTDPDGDNGGDGELARSAKLVLLGRIALAEGETGNGGETVPDSGENGSENKGENNGTENGGSTEEQPKEVKKYVSYREMGEGLAKSFIGEDLKGTLKTLAVEYAGGNDEVFGYYGYIFMGIGFFIVLWLILFLFAFFHMFAKNKRFMMWYVKMFCAWPCIIFWLIPTFIKPALEKFAPTVYEQAVAFISDLFGSKFGLTLTGEQASGIIGSVLSSFQTFAWISGICYLLLWIISICWAFPIKHKIRKLKKGY